jgi:hypothetical protein
MILMYKRTMDIYIYINLLLIVEKYVFEEDIESATKVTLWRQTCLWRASEQVNKSQHSDKTFKKNQESYLNTEIWRLFKHMFMFGAEARFWRDHASSTFWSDSLKYCTSLKMLFLGLIHFVSAALNVLSKHAHSQWCL